MELRLLFASDLPTGSVLKLFSLNRMQRENFNPCKKLHNSDAPWPLVRAACLVFPLCPTLYSTNGPFPYTPQDKDVHTSEDPIECKKRKSISSLVLIQQGTVIGIPEIGYPFVENSYMEYL